MRPEDVIDLMGFIRAFAGQKVAILETISAQKNPTSDPNFVPSSSFVMTVRDVLVSNSGLQFRLRGGENEAYYTIDLDRVNIYKVDNTGAVIISEQFEVNTTRLTRISRTQ